MAQSKSLLFSVYFSFFFKGLLPPLSPDIIAPCHDVTAPPLRGDSSLSAVCDAQQTATADEALEHIPAHGSCVTATERRREMGANVRESSRISIHVLCEASLLRGDE